MAPTIPECRTELASGFRAFPDERCNEPGVRFGEVERRELARRDPTKFQNLMQDTVAVLPVAIDVNYK
jgi:hypothetical protein